MNKRKMTRRCVGVLILSVLAVVLTLLIQCRAEAEPVVLPEAEPPAVQTAMAPAHEAPETVVKTLGYVIETPDPVIEEPVSVDEADAEMLARVMWGEARGLPEMEQAAVAWCVLNRVDAEGYGMGRQRRGGCDLSGAVCWVLRELPCDGRTLCPGCGCAHPVGKERPGRRTRGGCCRRSICGLTVTGCGTPSGMLT